MSVNVTVSQKDLMRITGKLSLISPKKRGKAILEGFRNAGLITERKLKMNVSGRILKVRTGRLRSSIGSKVVVDNQGMLAVVGSGVNKGKRVPYANIHETGGIIYPVNGKYLTIPIRAGSPEARRMGFKGKARAFSSKIVSFRKVESVKIPKRQYLSKTLQQMRKRIMQTIQASIRRGLSK